MKYLKLHYLLWTLLVIAFTLLDLVLWVVIYTLYVLWNFKLPKDLWGACHQSSHSDE